MSCDDVAAALVDEGLPRPPEFLHHLDGCATCRALAGLHVSALRLRLPTPPTLEPVTREAVLGEVRRRQFRRRVTASVAATAAMALLVWFVSPRVRPALEGETGPVVGGASELFMPVEPSGQPSSAEVARGEPASLGQLFGEVYGYTRTNPSLDDAAYRPFGALAMWVRPPDSTALDAEPFQTALAAFHVSRSR